MTMFNFRQSFLLPTAALVLSLGLSACGSTYLSPDENPFTNGSAKSKANILAKEDYTLEIIRFEDRRAARAAALDVTDDVIYEYEPDTLLGGVAHRLPVLFSKHFGYGLNKPNTLLVEMDVQKLKTLIKTGTFSSGTFGRYIVDLEIDVTVRDTDSLILLVDTYRQNFELTRKSFNGRSPSAEMDRSRAYQMVDEAVRRMAEEVALDAKPEFKKAQRNRKQQARNFERAQRKAAEEALKAATQK